MKTNKILIGTLAGGITYFLLGWIIYGIVMKDYMATNFTNCMTKPEADMIWWALILSNFMWAMAYAVIIGWSNLASAAGGLKVGLIVGLLIMISYDLSFYSMTNMFSNINLMLIDILMGTTMSTIGGAVIGAAMGMGKKE